MECDLAVEQRLARILQILLMVIVQLVDLSMNRAQCRFASVDGGLLKIGDQSSALAWTKQRSHLDPADCAVPTLLVVFDELTHGAATVARAA